MATLNSCFQPVLLHTFINPCHSVIDGEEIGLVSSHE
nr:MAG TPA: hypothetical protein [Caudoviricetes sp.]